MTASDIIRIIEKRLEKAESDLRECGRGSNHGRVKELRDLLDVLAVLTGAESEVCK